MRLGEKKFIYIRKSRETKKKFSAFLILMLMFSIFFYSSVYFLKTVRPVMIELSKAHAQNLAQRAINDAVLSLFAEGEIDSGDILIFEKDDSGGICAVKSNLDGVSRLKAELTMRIQDYIARLRSTKIRLPVGSFTGTDILAGVGPYFSLEFVPYGMTTVDFVSEFTDSGINQTRLSVDLDIKTSVGLLMPTTSSVSEVSTRVPVISTVIVGDVPDGYTNVDREDESFEDDVLQLAE